MILTRFILEMRNIHKPSKIQKIRGETYSSGDEMVVEARTQRGGKHEKEWSVGQKIHDAMENVCTSSNEWRRTCESRMDPQI